MIEREFGSLDQVCGKPGDKISRKQLNVDFLKRAFEQVRGAAPRPNPDVFSKNEPPRPLRPLRRETPPHPGDLVRMVR